MSPEQQRIAIAEACGWTEVWVDGREVMGVKPKYPYCPNPTRYKVPDYLNDLNAMHEVLKAVDNTDFMNQFITIIEDKLRLLTFSYEPRQTKDDWAILTADPAIYAEVFIETLDKMGERKV